jgi:hypothetical protein
MFLLLESADHLSYRTGQIIGEVDGFLLIHFNMTDAAIESMELYPLEELNEVCKSCGAKLALFFKEREQMQRYIDWQPEPPKKPGKIVPLRKPHEPKPL